MQNNGCAMHPPNNGLTRFVLDRTTRAIVAMQRHCKVITKHTTGTPILPVEASFNSAERGLRRGISSWTSLKCYIHFSFILKLIIFIYKQLKRPVAFSVVQLSCICNCSVNSHCPNLWWHGVASRSAPSCCDRSVRKVDLLQCFVPEVAARVSFCPSLSVMRRERPPLLLAVMCSWIMVVVGKQSGGWAAPRKLHHHSLFQMIHPKKDEFFGHSKMKDKTHSNTS